MLVDVKPYRLFYDILWKKFQEKEFPAGAINNIKLENLWSSEILLNERSISLTQLRFNASPMYFYKLRPPKKITEGSLEVRNISLAKALLYIEDQESDDHYKFVTDWAEEAERLWLLFNQKNFQKRQKNEIEKKENTDEIENTFLGIISGERRIFESYTLRKVAVDFWHAISVKDYFAAWTLLSPLAMINGAWGKEFYQFKKYFTGVVTADDCCVLMDTYEFQFRKVKFVLSHNEKGYLFDIHRFIAQSPNLSSGFSNMSEEDLWNLTTQKEFLAQLNGNSFDHFVDKYKAKKYYYTVWTNFSLEFVENRWLINAMHSKAVGECYDWQWSNDGT